MSLSEIIKHVVLIMTISLLLVLCMFSPYIPGDYDNFSIALFTMVQFALFGSLVLVPVALAWLLHKWIKKDKVNGRSTYRFAVACVLVFIIPIMALNLGAFVSGNRSLVCITLVVSLYIINRLLAAVKQAKTKFHSLPLYLVCVPVIVFFIRLIFFASDGIKQ